jgi:hypothetical protein
MHIFEVVLAYILSLLIAPLAAIGGVLLLAQVGRRLTRWRNADGSPGWMVSMPVGGAGWQVSSAIARAIAAFGAMRHIFWILGVPPRAYAAGFLLLILAAWDVHRLRFMQRPTLAAPESALAVARFKVGAGLIASVLGAIVFLRV